MVHCVISPVWFLNASSFFFYFAFLPLSLSHLFAAKFFDPTYLQRIHFCPQSSVINKTSLLYFKRNVSSESYLWYRTWLILEASVHDNFIFNRRYTVCRYTRDIKEWTIGNISSFDSTGILRWIRLFVRINLFLSLRFFDQFDDRKIFRRIVRNNETRNMENNRNERFVKVSLRSDI